MAKGLDQFKFHQFVLRDSLNRIPTQFSISSDDMDRIDQAVKLLVAPDNPTLVKIVQLLFPAEA